jgi:deoxyribonuclease V
VIACVDVDYREHAVVAACVAFQTWTDDRAFEEIVVTSDTPPAPYEPGRFYRRELPHLLGVLSLLVTPLDAVIVDGYVWLGRGNPGLGARLYDAPACHTTPVIGVAKTAYARADAIEVIRGASTRPLYVTSAGIDARAAAEHVREMHGDHRIPTLLRRVDQLARA